MKYFFYNLFCPFCGSGSDFLLALTLKIKLTDFYLLMKFHQLMNEFLMNRGHCVDHMRPLTSLTGANSPLTKTLANRIASRAADGIVAVAVVVAVGWSDC